MKEQISKLDTLSYPNYGFKSQYKKQIHELTGAWIRSYDCLTQDIQKKTVMANYGILTADIIPRASFNVIVPTARWMLWAFLFDDIFGPCPKDELAAICEKTINILKGQKAAPDDNVLFREIAIIRDELKTISSSEWMNRFIADHEYYFQGLLMDTYSYKKNITYPSSSVYLSIRNRLIGGYMVADLLELSSEYIFPEELYSHPDIQRIRILASQLMIWDNDIFSYQKELAEGEAMNMVLILKSEQELSLEEAVQKTIDLREHDYFELLNFKDNLAKFGKFKAEVENYIENLFILLCGQLTWYKQVSRRYQ